MKDRLPAAQLNQFLSRPEYVNRGFEMLHHLILHLNPSRPEHRLNDVRSLAAINMSSTETTSSYMLRIRTISNRLPGIQIDTLFPLFTIMGLDNERFGGICVKG